MREALRILAHDKLARGHGLVGAHQRLGGLQLKLDVEHHLAIGRHLVGQRELHGLLRRCIDFIHTTGLHRLAVSDEGPRHVVVAQVAEEIFVAHANLALLQVDGLSPDVLILVSHLVSVGIELTVGAYDAVAVEVVVRRILAVVVTTIGVER